MQMEMEERQGFEFMNFNEGDHLAGTLLEAGPETIEVPDESNPKRKIRKTVFNYLIEERDGAEYDETTGKLYKITQTKGMENKLRASDVGKLVFITCTGRDERYQRNGNAMKTFRIQVSKGPAPALSGLGITDSDIPF